MTPNAAAAVAAVLLAIAPIAQGKDRFKYSPPSEQLRADIGSVFIQGVLREPFTSAHPQNQVRIRILEESGNTTEARLLEQAENRRLLAAMTGDAYEQPATVGDAIAAEREKPPLTESIQAALDRVTIEHAPNDAAKAARVPEDFVEAAPGVWTRAQYPESLKVLVLATIRNGLAITLHHVGFKAGQGYSCPPDAESGAAPVTVPPGATATVMCWAADRAERMAGDVKKAAAHALGLPAHPFTLRTEAGSIFGGGDRPYIAGHDRDDAQRQQAWGRLVDAPCAQKGTCLEVKKGEEARQAQTARKERPALLVILGGFLAFIAALYAASRLRGDLDPPGVIRSLLSVVVIAYSGLLLAVLYLGVRPAHGSYDGMLALGLVYLGGLPFLAMLAIVAAAMGRNRLHAFAAAFGIGVVLVLLVLLSTGL